MYQIYDVTMPIFSGMPVYKNKPEKQPSFERVQSGYVSESRVRLDVHTGTHVDAPLHMIENGPTLETIPVERLVGPCRVIDLTDVTDGITREDLEKREIQPGEFVLFKTKNSFDEAFNYEFIYVKENAARYLAEKQIKGVGIDSLGIERSQPGHPTHKTLFEHDIVVIEGLRLRHVPEGSYFLVAAPLHLTGTDAAPARVLLFEGLL
jgi:arylformamidase